ncbi:SoxY-related AACIE arm protein [Pseudorhodoplanes sp.]|uniref:SoxY-related AACIE arm protein n=1 Tax=Pseudorhodoplanes sp. TaxID=1934341 RepID=UPI002CFDB47E|nr:SoxY-related AACIE arm protein [Pseudorhodoplanes sp.]HWV51156.1 SoxY-related AACIE arm protein [Pseudorhodoplanes sp.]
MERTPLSLATTRRLFLAGAGALLVVRPAGATPETMAAAIRQVTGGKPVTPGKVKLTIPPLVENGNAVAVTISADSPMTEKDHVTAIHLFTQKNPLPNVIGIRLGARAGKAEVSTRIRLADTQQLTALCEMSDGTFWSDTADVILTLSACLEDPV